MEIVSSENDRQLLANYAGEFSDGTPRGWEFNQVGANWEITFPNKAKVQSSQLLVSDIWSNVPAEDANTTILWRNSLAYLPRILQIDNSIASMEVVEGVISSFLEWFEDAASSDIGKLKSGSQDHQSALRIRTLLWILSFLSREDRTGEFERFMGLYTRLLLVENRLLHELNLYQPNNHGIMLGIAHLHAETLLPGLLPGEDAETWVARLYATLGEIIDEDGIASENTPIYQVFYVMLLEDVVSFVNWAGKFSGRARMFQLLLRAAQIGVRKQLLPTGAVPPLGDSPGGMQFRFKPMLGDLWSPKNGLSVVSRENEYLSFIAGFRSVIHKQLDDLSVAWWRDGEFIFRDAGLLSYDQNDPVAVAMRGNKGHSLPTYSHFDSWTTKNSISYGKNSSRLRGKLKSRMLLDDGVRFKGELALDEKVILHREVAVDFSEGVKITDSFLASRFGTPLVRFIADPSVDVRIVDANEVLLSRGSLQYTGRFRSPNAQIHIEILDTHVALEHHKISKTKEIIVTLPNSNGLVDISSSFKRLK